MQHGHEVRERLVKTAAKLFQRQGYAATGLNQILKESGVPKGSLYYYFPGGKEELAEAAITYIREHISGWLRDRLNDYDDPLVCMQHMLDEMESYFVSEERILLCTITLIACETSWKSEELREACRLTIQTFAGTYTDKLLACGYEPERAENIGNLLQMVVEEAMVNTLIRGDQWPFELVKERLPSLLEIDAP